MEQWAIDELNQLKERLIESAVNTHKYRRESIETRDDDGEAFFAGKARGLEEAISELEIVMNWFTRPGN